MATNIVCIPVAPDGTVGEGWGRAPALALARVTDGRVEDWRTVDVRWDTAHDEGSEGSHHARVARFVRDNGVTVVAARHMGEPMRNMLTKLGVEVRLGVDGDARTAAAS
jgi:predicted Fe-Mo cluster-binding NifX family protein